MVSVRLCRERRGPTKRELALICFGAFGTFLLWRAGLDRRQFSGVKQTMGDRLGDGEY